MGDMRCVGAGNIGATNVLRTGRKGLAAGTLLLDGGKGAAAVLIAGTYGVDMGLVAGLGAVLGHMFPLWLGFRGGKGVATSLGVLLGMAWPVGLAACATWLVVAAVTRISSLSALLALAAAPVFARVAFDRPQVSEMALLIAVLVWIAHRANIGRLLRGREPRIGQKAPPPDTAG